MGDSKIEWTNKTWPVVTGCSHAGSPGCDNCYAARMAATRLKHHRRYRGLAVMKHSKPRWTGEMRLNRDVLNDPWHWKKRRMVFVASMGDLFHPDVPTDYITQVWLTMESKGHHLFQVLTKRPERFAEFFEYIAKWLDIKRPLHNVWLGVTAEDQESAEERIPKLLDAPAAVRFVSCEPLLAEIDLWQYLALVGGLDWVIVGGESGPRARPMHPIWASRIRHDCMAAYVPFFFKQWGEWGPAPDWGDQQEAPWLGKKSVWLDIPGNSSGGYSAMMQGPAKLFRMGKKAAGRLLGGREWNEMPEVGAEDG